MTTLHSSKGQAKNQHRNLGGEDDETQDRPQHLVRHVLRVRVDVETGHGHGNHTTKNTENCTDPDLPVEAQEDGRVGGVELETGPLKEAHAEKDEETKIWYEN